MDEKLKDSLKKLSESIDISKKDLSDIIEDSIKSNSYKPNVSPIYRVENDFKKITEGIQAQAREDRLVQKNIEANTKKIAENTEWLSQSVNLIRINNERQTELLGFITEVLALSNETNKAEAESKLKGILNRVQGFKENFELAVFLKNMGDGIIKMITEGQV